MTQAQIKRFFDKTCNPQEAREVAAYLQQHPEIAEQYLSEQEWNELDTVNEPTEAFWQTQWQSIRKEQRKTIVRKRVWRGLAAGAVIAAVTWFSTSVFQPAQQPALTAEKKPQTEQVMPVEKLITNTDKKERTLVLEDHSVILLGPKSSVRFLTPFANNRRAITLEGTAIFKVAKDAARPFTVNAEGLATTALGTEFKIASSSRRVTVELYKGRVVVKATRQVPGWKGDVFLLAGQQVYYDNVEHKMLASAIPAEQKTQGNTESVNAKHEGPLAFNNTALSEVFDQLAKHYQVKIVYDVKELKGKNFTGNISASDAAALVLKVIAQMNELELVTHEDGFEVKAAGAGQHNPQ